MKKFLLKVVIFSALLVGLICLGLILPNTPKASQSLLLAKRQKDSLLTSVQQPRIVFVGGSNLSFGLNSQLIRDSLAMYPINTAIHAAIGLQYMLDSALPFVRENDLIIVAAEYQQFYGDVAFGSEELLRIVTNTDVGGLRSLTMRQLKNVLIFIPKYGLSRFNPGEYTGFTPNEIYGVNAFNQYGDSYRHWTLPGETVSPLTKTYGEFNQDVVTALRAFGREVEQRKATVLITFPGLQQASFNNIRPQIARVDSALKQNRFTVLGTPERYCLPDSLIFNMPYHLLKKGTDYRTQLLIEDLKDYLNTQHQANVVAGAF